VTSSSLLEQGNWSAVPATLPFVALAFVFHNVVPVVQLSDYKGSKLPVTLCLVS
jgi:hypothetical protein